MSFARYPAYKDSGVEWLGEVPEHWGVPVGRRIYRQVREQAHAGDVQLSATQKYGVIPQSEFMEAEDQKVMLALKGLDNFKHVEKNDFVISLRSFQGGIEHSAYSGCVSPAYTVLRAQQEIDPSYMAFALKSSGYISALQSATDGIRDGKNISYDQFGSIGLPLPSLPEQTAIATFLDRETARIDALVAEQERLIALLKEKRQAVISHAVTKGLNPDAPMKDSGVEWLGEVPAHWEVMRTKHFVMSLEQGWSPQCENFPVQSEDEWGVLKVGCVNGGVFRSEENKALPSHLEPIIDLGLRAGDVLISRANTRELVGSAAVVLCDFPRLLLCDKLYRLRLDMDRCEPAYLALYFGVPSVRGQIELAATGASSSMLNISQPTILELEFVAPPLNEQSEILRAISDQTSQVDALIKEADAAMKYLQERRAALISAAVTGQIDVRELAPAEAA